MLTFDTSTTALVGLPPHLRQLSYCGMDSMMTREIWDKIEPIAVAKDAVDAYERTRSYLPVICDMMQQGWKIDVAEKDRVLAEYKRQYRRLELYFNVYARRVWGKPLNHRSPKQLQEFFFDALMIPVKFATKKGEMRVSTDRNTLEGIARDYIRGALFANFIMRMRDLEKMIQTLSSGLRDGRWLFNFNAAGTDTFRWSSSAHPLGYGGNIQNIKDRVRRMFVADEGWTILNFDQQGAEARYVAYKCGDEAYINAVETGDVHTIVAAMCFGFEPKRDLAERKYYRDWSYRDISKRATHGTSYGGTARTIARVTKLEEQIIEAFQAKLRLNFPGIFEWQRWVAYQIQTKARMTTALGDTRHFFGRTREDTTIRAAIAFEPQSVVGRHTANGLARVRDLQHPDIRCLSNGHDAAIFLARGDIFGEIIPLIRKTLTVPIVVPDIHGKERELIIPWDCAYGQNWGKQLKDKATGAIINPDGLKEYKYV
jgi:DNA polymerase I-like protein with 3'-5' exonuclease and polymerase domains